MAITIEDTQTVINMRAEKAQKEAELKTLQEAVAGGIETTLDSEVSAKQEEIELYGNRDDVERSVWEAQMIVYQHELLVLNDANRAIKERNEVRQGDVSSQIITKQAEIDVVIDQIKTFLTGLTLGAPDPVAPTAEERISAIEGALIQIAGV